MSIERRLIEYIDKKLWSSKVTTALVSASKLKEMRALLDELSRLREVERRLRKDLAFADEQSSKVEALLEPHIKWDEPQAHEPGTIRICPMRDGPCRHGLNCPYVGDGYMGYPCKEGWNGARALSEREGQE